MPFHFFISHNHKDKPIARRIAWRLQAHGYTIWLDESELRLGNALTDTIKEKLADCDTVLVIVSKNSEQSKWVKKEIEFGKEHGKEICPLFLEQLTSKELISDYLGLDMKNKYYFEQELQKLLLSNPDVYTPLPNEELIRASFESVKQYEPRLKGLIDGCLSGIGLPLANIEHSKSSSFHMLDYTLTSLYLLADTSDMKQLVSYHASQFFPTNGVGSYVLMRYAEDRMKHDTVIVSAVGRELTEELLDVGIWLLSQGKQVDDQALSSFISKNATKLNEEQVLSVMQLGTSPLRKPEGFATDVTFFLIKQFPEQWDPINVVNHWIDNGEFDGMKESTSSPLELIRCFTIMLRGEVPQSIENTLSSHLRGLVRSRDKAKVVASVDYLIAGKRENYDCLDLIYQVIDAALGSDEWNRWEEHEEMHVYVTQMLIESKGEGNFLNAMMRYREKWKAIQEFNRVKGKLS